MNRFLVGGAFVIAASAGCVGEIGDGGDAANGSGAAGPGSVTETLAAEPAIARLSRAQLTSSWRALLGEPLDVPADLPDDDQLYGFTSIAAARATISTLDAEQYETATYALLDQVWKDPARRDAFLGCTPTSVSDLCARTFFKRFGRRAWRRGLEASEVDALVALGSGIAKDLGDASEGLRFSVAAMLQAPDFLFRIDLGDKDPKTGKYGYTGYEMASRLSFLLTDAPPDDALLDAAEHGELKDPARLRAWASRLVDDPRARPALVHFFRDFMGVARLDGIDKSADVFPAFTPTLGASMRGEIERLFEAKVFDDGGDFRGLFTTRETFVNEELAKVYGIAGVTGPALVKVTLPNDGRRAGLLTTPGFLAMNAHKIATSPTRRGRFVRMGLLCEDIPPPPPNVNTTLPPPKPGDPPKTLRMKLEEHRSNAACATCHDRMDPIGFGLEHFDALGQWRAKDNGLPVDDATELDGTPFHGGAALGGLVAEMPGVGTCIARRFYQHAVGHLDASGEAPAVDALQRDFAASSFDFRELVLALVTSDGFRFATPPSK